MYLGKAAFKVTPIFLIGLFLFAFANCIQGQPQQAAIYRKAAEAYRKAAVDYKKLSCNQNAACAEAHAKYYDCVAATLDGTARNCVEPSCDSSKPHCDQSGAGTADNRIGNESENIGQGPIRGIYANNGKNSNEDDYDGSVAETKPQSPPRRISNTRPANNLKSESPTNDKSLKTEPLRCIAIETHDYSVRWAHIDGEKYGAKEGCNGSWKQDVFTVSNWGSNRMVLNTYVTAEVVFAKGFTTCGDLKISNNSSKVPAYFGLSGVINSKVGPGETKEMFLSIPCDRKNKTSLTVEVWLMWWEYSRSTK